MVEWRILTGDVRDVLSTLPANSVQTVVTSPPYWGLRDYGVEGQIGLERTPDEYVASLVEVFAAVWRVLADDGTLWLNLGDCYANDGKWGGETGGLQSYLSDNDRKRVGREKRLTGLKPKDLVGIPWRVAFALQAAGWYLRSDIVWSKPNPMPESVQDRPTKAHEYIFLLTKRERYFYDAAAIREPYSDRTLTQFDRPYTGEGTKDYSAAGVQNPSDIKRRIVDKQRGHGRRHAGFNKRWDAAVAGARAPESYDGKYSEQGDQDRGRRLQSNAKRLRETGADHNNPFGVGANKRSVWTVTTQPYPEAHFATFPEALIEPCIFAGSRPGDAVLDPFCGSGTTGAVAIRHQRNFIGVELNPSYVELARRRIGAVAPLFASEASA